MNIYIHWIVQLLMVISLTLSTHGVWAQAGSTKVTVRVVAYYQGKEETGWKNESTNNWRWNFWYNGSSTPYCIKKDAKEPGWWYDDYTIVSNEYEAKVPGFDATHPPLFIKMESWEEDKGDDCRYNTGDDTHYGPDSTVAIYNLYQEQPPGTSSEATMRKAYNYNIYNKVTYRFFYTPPTPDKPNISGNLSGDPSGICVKEAVTLSSNTYVNPSFHDQVQLHWEYRIEGEFVQVKKVNPDYCGRSSKCAIDPNPPSCCYDDEYITVNELKWYDAGYTTANVNSGKKTVTLNTLAGLNNIQDRKTVYFRVRSKANDVYGDYSAEKTIVIDPPGILFDVSPTKASCSAQNTGKVTINITGNTAGDYRYQIHKDGEADTLSQSFVKGSYTIGLLFPGTYNIKVSRNNALSKCDITKTVVVATEGDIAWNETNTNSINPACPGQTTGSITLETKGGRTDRVVTFSITNPSNTSYDKSITSIISAEFSGLPAGTYIANAYDACNNTTLTKTFTLTEPPKVVASVSFTNPTCAVPNDGAITVNVTSKQGNYGYELLKGTVVYKTKTVTTATSYTFTGLPAGSDYTVQVYDANLSCNASFVQTNISIKFTPLSLSFNSRKDINCAGGTGSITVTASGGSNKYNYTLAHSSGKYTQNNTTGVFTVDRGGTYTAKVTNQQTTCNDMATYAGISIIEPAPLSVAVTQQNITCSGQSGSLQAAVSGGTLPYTYNWQEKGDGTWYNYSGAGRGTPTITGVYEGTYGLIITDKNNCIITTGEYTLTDPEELSIDDVAVQHITCLGANDSRIIPTANGGWGNYVYAYRKAGQTNFTTFTDTTPFASGTYTVQVTDKEGCSVTYGQTLTISEPENALTLQYTLSAYDGYQVSCFDSDNGWIDASATGGNSAPFGNQYLFALDGGAFSTNARFEGLSAGNYILKVKDERGCILTQAVTLSAPAELILATADKNYIQCFGDSTGYITLQASGGVSPYQYRLNSGDWQDSPAFEHLPAGEYALTVADARGCEAVLLESITTNNPLLISFDKTDVRCYGENNGEITATVSGGKAPYVLHWQQVSSSQEHIASLAPGWYTLTITDADACTMTDSVLVWEPEAALSTLPVATPVRCFQENNGTVTLPTIGGNPPYRYSIDGGATFQTDSLFTGLVAGTYTVLTIDSKGCAFISEAIITEPELLEISLESKTDILCHNEATGAITVSANGGTTPYSYSLDGAQWQDTSMFINLPARAYNILLKDARGCQTSMELTLIQPEAPLALTYQVTPVQCKETPTGAITTAVTGGTSPYTYEWDNLADTTGGQSNADVSGLSDGEYVLIITDAHGCQLRDTIAVTEPDIALQAGISIQRNVSCFGLSDGFVEIEALGGYPPYQYAWQGGNFSDTLAYGNLAEGHYQMIIKDTMNCQVTLAIYISQPDVLTIASEVLQHVSCFTGSDAVFVAKVTGGTQSYRYSPNAGLTWQAEAVFAGYPKGAYTILVEDAQGCTASTQVNITEPALLTASIDRVVTSACNQANGEAQAVAQGGTPPYRYAWINQKKETIATVAYPKTLYAGVYDVYVTDAKDCQVHLTQIISDLDGPVSRIASFQDARCFTSSDGSATVVATGGTGSYQYLWSVQTGSLQTGSDEQTQTSATATGLMRGEYFVTVTDERGCKSISSVTIGSPDALRLDTVQWQHPSCFQACDGQIDVIAKGGIAPYTYRWEGHSEILPALDQLCRDAYMLTVTDAVGCSFTQVLSMAPPDLLQLSMVSIKPPTCFQGCDGQVQVSVQGGTAPYRYEWNDSFRQTTAQADNLCPGSYTVTVTDAQNCSTQQQVTIQQTPSMALNLPDTVNLCLDQQVTLDASILTGQYQWTHNGIAYSNNASITVEQAGTYQVAVTNAQGCTEMASTQVNSYDTLFEVNFLQSTELYTGDTLTLSEICFPMPDSVQWKYTPGVQMLDASPFEPQITFQQAGSYQVTLIGYYSVCSDSITKTVIFFPAEQNKTTNSRLATGPQGIKSITVYPNPTDGHFRVEVALYAETDLYVFLHDTGGQELSRASQQGKDFYTFDYDISPYTSGEYYLRLVTPYDKKVARILLR